MQRPLYGSSGGPWSVKAADVLKDIDVAEIRLRERLTQKAFAKRYGLTDAAVRDWETGRKQPSGAARVLLTLIDRAPEAVRAGLRV